MVVKGGDIKYHMVNYHMVLTVRYCIVEVGINNDATQEMRHANIAVTGLTIW